jgi:hypothetical protein
MLLAAPHSALPAAMRISDASMTGRRPRILAAYQPFTFWERAGLYTSARLPLRGTNAVAQRAYADPTQMKVEPPPKS